MAEAKYHCRKCNNTVNETEEVCPHCGYDLSNGRNISISFSDSIRLSDEAFVKIVDDIKLEPNDLAMFGIFLTLIVGVIPLYLLIDRIKFILALVFATLTSILLIIAFIKIRYLRVILITILRWLLK